MSNYTKVTNFTAKDSLPSGNPGKVVRGSEIDTEFSNIQTAVNSKSDTASPTFTGTVTIPTVAISGGTITGITDLAIADGGTGASTAQAARNNLLPSQSTNAGKYLKTDGTDVSWDNLDISTADITGTLPIANGGTGATSASAARTALGLAIGTDVQAYDAQLADIAGLTPTDNNFIVGNGTNFVTESGATARTSLGLGSIATQDASNVNITGGSVTGITDLAVADGGTGASTASGARTNLGLGTIATQDASNVAVTGGAINGTTVGASTAASGAFTSLTSSSTTTLNGTTIPASKTLLVSTDIGSTVQGYDAQLADIAGLTPTDNGVIIGNGTNFVVESGATLKTSLGLTIGTDVQAYDSNLTSFVGVFTLPTTDGTNGQALVTNGSGTLSFANVDALPSQTGNAGKYLTTNGTTASWGTVTGGGAEAGGAIFVNSTAASVSYTIPSGSNGFSVGPVTVNSGVTVTVSSGQRWLVL